MQFVLLANTSGNAVAAAEYFLRAIDPRKYSANLGSYDQVQAPNPPSDASKGLALGVITTICLIHLYLPKFGGRYLMTVLAAIKVGLLCLVIIAGVVASAGIGDKNPERANFRSPKAWDIGPNGNAAGNWAVALLGVRRLSYYFA